MQKQSFFSKSTTLIAILAALTVSLNVCASTMLPAKVQAMLMFKVLGFEKRLKASSKSSLTMVVLYQSGNEGSALQKDQIVSALTANSSKTVAGKALIVNAITGLGDMADADIVYIAAGNDDRLANVLEECQKLSVLAVTGVPEYAEKGVPLTLAIENSKPKIVINKSAADSCGVDFSSQILALAKVI